MNGWIHRQIGVNLLLYSITDWLGFVPVGVGMLFGGLGVAQLIQRKSLLKVDRDILLLGGYYLLVIVLYLAFERLPINYRPVFIENRLEASYPSSTTLLVLSVMPTLVFHVNRRWKTIKGRRAVTVTSVMFSLFMVIGRLLSGVHWFSDIVGSVLLSMGLFYLYKATVLLWDKRKN